MKVPYLDLTNQKNYLKEIKLTLEEIDKKLEELLKEMNIED